MATNPPYIDVIALNFRPILVCRIATLILMPPHTVISNWFWYGYGSCDGIRIHTCELSISALVANQYSVLLSSAHHHHHRHCHHSEVEAYPISIQFNLNNRFSNLSYLIRMFNVQSLCCVCVCCGWDSNLDSSSSEGREGGRGGGETQTQWRCG